MHSKSWLIFFNTLTFEGVAYLLEERFLAFGFEGEQVGLGEVAIFIQRFTVAQADGGSLWALDSETYDARQVLTKVQHCFATRSFENGGGKGFFLAHRNAHRSHQMILGVGGHSHRFPDAIVEPQIVPSGHFQAGIIDLAVFHVGFEDGAGG